MAVNWDRALTRDLEAESPEIVETRGRMKIVLENLLGRDVDDVVTVQFADAIPCAERIRLMARFGPAGVLGEHDCRQKDH